MADEAVVDEQTQQVDQPDQAIVDEARRGGWRPKDDFKGDPNVWVDAGTFVKRGREVLPHVQRHAAKLEQELATERAARVKLEGEQAELRAQVTGLTTFQQELAGKERERIRNELAADLRAARESGDTQAEARILDQLSAPPPPVKTAPVERKEPVQQQQIPTAMTEWLDSNSWAKNDPVMMQAMSVVGAELRSQGKLTGMDLTAQLNATAKVVSERYMPNRQLTSRAESGSRGSGNGGGGEQQADGPSYEKLSAQEKAECDDQGQRLGLVGKGKSFADLPAWRKHFVTQLSRYAPGVGYNYKPPGN